MLAKLKKVTAQAMLALLTGASPSLFGNVEMEGVRPVVVAEVEARRELTRLKRAGVITASAQSNKPTKKQKGLNDA